MGSLTRWLRVGLFAAVVGTPSERAAAQWTPALWADLVQMPVAVARLQVAGVPVADLRFLVPALNVQTVSPTLFLESVRGMWVLDGWGVDPTRIRQQEGRGMGGYVQALHTRGLRGTDLADAIHRQLHSRGIPAGPKRPGAAGYYVLAPDFVAAQTGWAPRDVPSGSSVESDLPSGGESRGDGGPRASPRDPGGGDSPTAARGRRGGGASPASRGSVDGGATADSQGGRGAGAPASPAGEGNAGSGGRGPGSGGRGP